MKIERGKKIMTETEDAENEEEDKLTLTFLTNHFLFFLDQLSFLVPNIEQWEKQKIFSFETNAPKIIKNVWLVAFDQITQWQLHYK